MYIGLMPNIHIPRAEAMGIHIVYILILAVRAILNTGTAIKAATAGRMPLNILATTGLSRNSLKKNAMHKIITNEGKAAPKALIIAPGKRLIL